MLGGSGGIRFLIVRSVDWFSAPPMFGAHFRLVMVSLDLIQVTGWTEAKADPWRSLDRI